MAIEQYQSRGLHYNSNGEVYAITGGGTLLYPTQPIKSPRKRNGDDQNSEKFKIGDALIGEQTLMDIYRVWCKERKTVVPVEYFIRELINGEGA